MESEDSNSDSPLGFTSAHVTDDLFKEILKGIDPEASLVHWRPSKLNTENSVLAKFCAAEEEVKSFVGHICYKVQYKLPGDAEDIYHAKKIVLKAKPQADETVKTLVNIAKSIDKNYGEAWDKFIGQLAFSNTNHREIEALRLTHPTLTSIRPRIFYTWIDTKQQIFVYVMENFTAEGYTHMDTVLETDKWTTDDIEDALKGISGMHASFYGNISDLPDDFSKWMDPPHSTKLFLEKMPLWKECLKHNAKHFPDIWPKQTVKLMQNILDNLGSVSAILEESPQTLVHNDCNIRNVCLRPNPSEGQIRLCLYDWELATFAPPQHDVAEFLAFLLPPNASRSTWYEYVEKYRVFLRSEVEKRELKNLPEVENALKTENFHKVFDMSVVELLVNRFALYGLVHYTNPYPFLGRVVASAANYVQIVRDDYDFLQNTN